MSIKALFDLLVLALTSIIIKIGYAGIFIGMLLESTPFPLPSELIMIPAGIASGHEDLNLFAIIFFGVAGNTAGAALSYFVAKSLGRKILIKIGKYFFLNQKRIEKMEGFFLRHGEISVFIGRMLPGFRHFVSITAGVARMDIRKFLFFTLLGSGIWTSILAILGFYIGKNEDLVRQYLDIAILGSIIFCTTLILFYLFFANKRSVRK
jgi:membrane protein DedA with SNARE-associated domain